MTFFKKLFLPHVVDFLVLLMCLTNESSVLSMFSTETLVSLFSVLPLYNQVVVTATSTHNNNMQGNQT